MKINSIQRTEFKRLLPQQHPLEELMGRQIEWFSNEARSLIGTIALTRIGRSWNFAVLLRYPLQAFQVCHIGENFFNLHQTRVQLLAVMANAKRCRTHSRARLE